MVRMLAIGILLQIELLLFVHIPVQAQQLVQLYRLVNGPVCDVGVLWSDAKVKATFVGINDDTLFARDHLYIVKFDVGAIGERGQLATIRSSAPAGLASIELDLLRNWSANRGFAPTHTSSRTPNKVTVGSYADVRECEVDSLSDDKTIEDRDGPIEWQNSPVRVDLRPDVWLLVDSTFDNLRFVGSSVTIERHLQSQITTAGNLRTVYDFEGRLKNCFIGIEKIRWKGAEYGNLTFDQCETWRVTGTGSRDGLYVFDLLTTDYIEMRKVEKSGTALGVPLHLRLRVFPDFLNMTATAKTRLSDNEPWVDLGGSLSVQKN